MKKTYNRRKIHRQAVFGWLILASGFVVQFALEAWLWGGSRPDMAAFVIGLPFSIGGLIFGHALITLIFGEAEKTLAFLGLDRSEIYRANMHRLRRRLPVAVLTTLAGFISSFLFMTNFGQVFFIGLPLAFFGVIAIVLCYHCYARCPACRILPTNSRHDAFVTNLDRCPNCGVKLGPS